MKQLKNTITAAVFSLFMSATCFAQTNGATLQPLTVGDSIGDLTMTNLINYPAATLKLSDFKDKLIILDFWATWCGSCIKTFPETYALQKKYAQQLQFLLVNTQSTRDTKIIAQNFMAKKKAVYVLPSVVMDTTLNKLFPHHTIPHIVWIKNGRILAITASGNVTEANIEGFIRGMRPILPVKKDFRTNPEKPLFVDGNGGQAPPFIYRSMLSAYVPGLRAGRLITDDQGKVTGCQYAGDSKLLLYLFANPQFGHFSHERTIFNVAHPEDYYMNSPTAAWREKNLFVYEATFPPRSKEEARKVMNDDLDRYFGLTLDSVFRELPCWVLRMSKHSKPNAVDTTAARETNIDDGDGSPIYITNVGILALTNPLETLTKTPVLDETSYEKAVNLNLPANLLNEKELKASLEKQGFTLTKETRKISYLRVSEPGMLKQ